MPPLPWWIQRVTGLLAPASPEGMDLGPLWRLSERLLFIRENVEAHLLPLDFAHFPEARAVWSAFAGREAEVGAALKSAGAAVATTLRSGELSPQRFRASWEQLGFVTHAEGAGTPADDHLDGLLEVGRLTLGEARGDFGNLNVSSRACRVADFLSVIEPGTDDVVFDLGSGNGKLALTVGASSLAQVRGVELGRSYVEAARNTGKRLGLANVGFVHADVREVELSEGSVFYLYFPFSGPVARAVAEALGRLARTKDIAIYSSGPLDSYGEHFLAQVENGALVVSERRGEFSETMVLRSARA